MVRLESPEDREVGMLPGSQNPCCALAKRDLDRGDMCYVFREDRAAIIQVK